MQNRMSALLFYILFPSSVSAAINKVICRMKSVITEIPATRQNDCSAGTSVKVPMKNASASQKAAANIEGPISFIANATLISI